MQKIQKGFTLIELLVATSIFTVAAVYGTSILLSSQAVYQRISTNRQAIDNLNPIMDIMTRDIRYGLNYGCVNNDLNANFYGSTNYTNLPYKNNIGINNTDATCNAVAFNSQDQEVSSTTVFYFNKDAKSLNKVDYKCASETDTFCYKTGDYSLTSSDLQIDKFIIKVLGSSATDDIQPSVSIFISSIIKLPQNLTKQVSGTSTIVLQSFVSQKVLDK